MCRKELEDILSYQLRQLASEHDVAAPQMRLDLVDDSRTPSIR
jgi:hypothetical protein